MTRPRLLVLRPLGLGDFLTGVPAYRALARAFPNHDRVLAVPAALHTLVSLGRGAFHRALDARPLDALPGTLRGVDVAVDLHGRGPASHRILLALEPKRLVAFAHADIPESSGGAPFEENEHEVRRWCRMLAHAGIPADQRDLGLDVPRARPSFYGATIVHPGAASESRRWPIERWIDVARFCASRGERVVVTGNILERERAAHVVRGAGLGEHRNLAGLTSLSDLASLVAFARRLVAGDTGIAHLATAYGTPSIVLFGPTSPEHWGPPVDRRHRVLWSGRLGDPHARNIDPGLLAIEARDVIDAIERAERRPVA